METFFRNSKNSKTNEPYKFKYDLNDKLDLKNPNKNKALANLSIYYTWKNVKSTYNNNKFKISAPTWNETFDLPDGSYNISEMKLLGSTSSIIDADKNSEKVPRLENVEVVF